MKNPLFPGHTEKPREGESGKLVGCVGISDHAQVELTNIVYVELSKVDMKLTAGRAVAVVESGEVASDSDCSVGGEGSEINEGLAVNPAFVNTSPRRGLAL